jgi:alkanesulfonate monooxygenase SsuD/methylene tetrahydromethanopterin reductase-like flavin-dependent oxidoreductase (luciferase family)
VTAGRRAIGLTPMETRLDVIVRAAELADELDYEAVQVPEGWGLDATLLLSQLIPRTRRITLATSVLSIWGRTPATLAMGAATLHATSGGRHILGLGASSPALVEGFHDRVFERPSEKLREVATAVRNLLDGGRCAQSPPGAGLGPCASGCRRHRNSPSGWRRSGPVRCGLPRRSPTAGAPPGCRGIGSGRRPPRWPTSGPPLIFEAHR